MQFGSAGVRRPSEENGLRDVMRGFGSDAVEYLLIGAPILQYAENIHAIIANGGWLQQNVTLTIGDKRKDASILSEHQNAVIYELKNTVPNNAVRNTVTAATAAICFRKLLFTYLWGFVRTFFWVMVGSILFLKNVILLKNARSST